MQDLREQDNISVHSDIHSDIHSDRMSEPPPPPTPPIPSRPPVIQEQTPPPPPPQAAPLIQQTQQTFHQHQIFNAINDSTPTMNSEDTKILQQKRRMPPALLTDEQKQIVAEEMNTANLGPICSGIKKISNTSRTKFVKLIFCEKIKLAYMYYIPHVLLFLIIQFVVKYSRPKMPWIFILCTQNYLVMMSSYNKKLEIIMQKKP